MVIARGDDTPKRRRVPSPAELRRCYVEQATSLEHLATRYGVGKPTVRAWLVEAGVTIRVRGDGGYHRQLKPPPVHELRALLDAGHTVPQLTALLAVSDTTVRRWLTEAGLPIPTASLKDRPRGAPTPVQRPPASDLRVWYLDEQLSLHTIAARLAVGAHLVRIWLGDAGIDIRPAGGRRGVTRPLARPLKTIPPVEELRALRLEQRLALPVIAARYGVHPSTVARWCRHHGLPVRVPARGDIADDEQMIRLYTEQGLSAAQVARDTGATDSRVLAVLHAAGVQIDPRRQAAAVRANAAERSAATASLTPPDAARAVELFAEGWSYRHIAAELGVSSARVRRELARQQVPPRARPTIGPSSRRARGHLPVTEVRALYVESEQPAEEVGARLDSAGWMVLRTAHAHGLPVRQGGYPAVSATVVLIEALYADDQIARTLARHGITARPAGGDIADRFPQPVPLTAQLLVDLYVEDGCSSGHIELLTGQSQAVVRATMHRLTIPMRAEHMSPALRRMREAARTEFLAGVVQAHTELGSSRLVWERYGATTTTAHRWLTAAGIQLPGRGRWTRRPNAGGSAVAATGAS